MNSRPLQRRERHYVAAVVLGTALSAFGQAGTAPAQPVQISESTVGHLSRYCSACWRNARLPVDRWGDCTQEVFARLLHRVSAGRWPELLVKETAERRELVRAVDAVKKRTQREGRRVRQLAEVVVDDRGAAIRTRAETREAVASAAGQLLSPRQQDIIAMSFDGSSVTDIAQALNLSPDRVSDEKYKAVRKLRDYFT